MVLRTVFWKIRGAATLIPRFWNARPPILRCALLIPKSRQRAGSTEKQKLLGPGKRLLLVWSPAAKWDGRIWADRANSQSERIISNLWFSRTRNGISGHLTLIKV